MFRKPAWILFPCILAAICLYLTWQSDYLVRAIIYNEPSIEDYKIFPERKITAASRPFHFAKDTTNLNRSLIDSAFSGQFNISSSSTLEAFLKSTQTTAFIILKEDTLIYERYFNGYTRESINTSFSTSKSITAILVGIALFEGLINSIDDPISKYLPELASKTDETLTVKSLMTMTSGIAYDEESRLFGDDARAYYGKDLRQYALGLEVDRPAGTAFKYNNINPLLIGMIIERQTGSSVSKYLEEKIWIPIGAEFQASWSLDLNGFEKMESGINARAIDFLKFGYLCLKDGRLAKRQIIPESYLHAATTRDKSSPERQDVRRDISYGYFWWIMKRYHGRDDYSAEGNLGQFIYISPATETVIVRHGKAYDYNAWPHFFYKLVNVLDGLPPIENPFEIEYRKHGINAAILLTDSLRLLDPPVLISEYDLNQKGYDLLSQNQFAEAIAVFQLNVRCHPKSSNVYDSLGEAYLKNNQVDLAKINYLKSLTLNPNNSNAKRVLESLE